MARRRFFIDSVHSGQARISGDEAHHLTRVLRVEPGQRFEISDNRNVYLAEVSSARKDLVSFAILEQMDAIAPVVRVTLLASLIKFERFEWMLEKATELGVERVIPVEAERSEKGLEQAAAKRLARWNRIAREASEQSRRARLPELAAPISLATAIQSGADCRYVLEEEAAPPILSRLPGARHPGNRVALLCGPEGGWTDRERSAISAAGWTAVSLGQAILRAETAALAALAILNAAWAAA
ncbi:MAG: 16S rRNA (uracil(1498)-N(3))-methyltransferase [Acidobacteriia bacterium]|nr:16S rRNA (uracil(1498)-N(3))-methyltransferase [Terriglobia bacterium]